MMGVLDMQTVGNADRYVIARENNVVLVDFRRRDPPAPQFPGAGALRALKGIEEGFDGWLRSDACVAQQLARAR
jgi:hypothetical protein